MQTKKRYGISNTNKININRGTIAELDKAIADLEARGYELVKRDDVTTVNYSMNFNYRDGRGSKYKYTGNDVGFARCKAVMKRIVPYGEKVGAQ